MENTLSTLLARISPCSLFQILENYTKAWAKNIQTPFISFGLHNGQEVTGELVHIDFPTERLIVRQIGDGTALHTTFLDFRHIQHFTLLGLEQAEAFVNVLTV